MLQSTVRLSQADEHPAGKEPSCRQTGHPSHPAAAILVCVVWLAVLDFLQHSEGKRDVASLVWMLDEIQQKLDWEIARNRVAGKAKEPKLAYE